MDPSNILQDYLMTATGSMTEAEFSEKNGMSTEEYENTFAEENNTDISGAESIKDVAPTGFNEGGLADDGSKMDPISGNDVPAGSMQEEVRDDIDAKLSEGEYVIPANVVRFFGVDRFEKMIAQAEKGLGEMEAKGRIGGEPVAEEAGYAEGGLVPTFNPEDWKTVGANLDGVSTPTAPDGGYEYRPYTNAQGITQMILFINGSPAQPIPEGFSEGNEPPVAADPVEDRKRTRREPREEPKERVSPLAELNFEDPDSITTWASDRLAGENPLLDLLGTASPAIGGALSLADQARKIAEVRAAALAAGDAGNNALQMQLDAQADAAAQDSRLLSMVPEGMMDGDRIFADYAAGREAAIPNITPSEEGITSPEKARVDPNRGRRKSIPQTPTAAADKNTFGKGLQGTKETTKTNYSKGGFVTRRKY